MESSYSYHFQGWKQQLFFQPVMWCTYISRVVFRAVFAHQLFAFAHLQRRSCVENTLAAMDGLIERTSATLIDTYPPSKSEIAQVKPQFLHKEILQLISTMYKWSKFAVHYLKFTVDGDSLPCSLILLALYSLAFVGVECSFSMTTPSTSSFPPTSTKVGWVSPAFLGNEFEVLGPKPELRLLLMNCHEIFRLTCFFWLYKIY